MKLCPTCQATYPSRFSVCPQDGAALVESSEWSTGTVIRGKYRILGKVGQGGMGAVYKASHVAFDELRALKVINPALIGDEHFLKRFKQEAIIARKLDHPNAVRVDDIDETESGQPFIVMEYIEGRSLKDLIEKEAPLPAGRTCSIVRQVAAGLGAAHHLGMVHRDVKPANVVLVNTPGGEQAKVLDFGIAKVREASSADSSGMTLTGTGIVIGTPQYMSPEQALGKRGDQLDGRSDLYSLGVVMYQMLTGDLPFKADTTMQLLLAHINTPPRPVLEARPGSAIPPALARVVMKCLEKDPAARPSTGAALIEELNEAATAESSNEEPHDSMTATSLAAPPPGGYAGPKVGTTPPPPATPEISQIPAAEPLPRGKKARSNGIVAAVVAVIVVLGVIGTVWSMHHLKMRSHPPSPVAASASHGAASAANPPPGIAQPTSEANAVKTAETTTPQATGETSELSESGKTMRTASHVTGNASKSLATAPAIREPRTQKIPSSTQASVAAPASVNPTPPPASTSLTTTPASNPELATVVVTSAPGAQIFIDGKHAGTTNSSGRLAVANLAPGAHDLRAALAGFSDIEYTIRVPPGATSFVTAKWGASQAATPAESAPGQARSGAGASKGVAASFPVAYLHAFGSSRGLLIIQGGNVHYQPSNGKGAFISPVSGISWGSNGGNEFNIRVKGGQNYRFRSPDAPNILATLKRAVSE